jgi:hypothetical protein
MMRRIAESLVSEEQMIRRLFRKSIENNITEETFSREEAKYLQEAEQIPQAQLQTEIRLLLELSCLPLDAEEISGILNCSVDDAEMGLKHVLQDAREGKQMSAPRWVDVPPPQPRVWVEGFMPKQA